MVADRCAVGRVVQVQDNIASGLYQLCGVNGAIISRHHSRQITILGGTHRPSRWIAKRRCIRQCRAVRIALPVHPQWLKILHIRVVRIETHANVMRHFRMLWLDLYGTNPSVFFKTGRNGDGGPFNYIVLGSRGHLSHGPIDDKIRLDLPTIRPLNSERSIFGFTLRFPRIGPLCNCVDLGL